ncbi:aminodeoxychorismate synthase component I [bacterium]|nr:aminodeoxychorismate synthase component I [bacterium]
MPSPVSLPLVTPYPPVVRELATVPSVMSALRACAHRNRLLLFDSAAVRPERGRYSYLMADPIVTEDLPEARYGDAPFAPLQQWLGNPANHEPADSDIPPFQGGIAGLMCYELGGCWERLPAARHARGHLPVFTAGLYPWVIAWDHISARAWIIAHGWPEYDRTEADRLATQRADEVERGLRSIAETPDIEKTTNLIPSSPPAWARPITSEIWSDFDRNEYLLAVQKVIDYITAGDIFQANLTQRLWLRATADPITLYEQLRSCNPAPFAGFLQGDGWAILSASPERYLQVQDRIVTTRPIKGTRRRSARPEADLFTRDILRESEKDQAENVMIVDLLRNDLSRVCRPGSVNVPQLCQVETFATVQHLVSEVQGTLEDSQNIWDLFAMAFPGGSITGAPKIRAMEIIAELEPTRRGPYTGSLFYVGHNGTVDSNLLIRTFLHQDGWLECGVGGGIVAQSDPVSEYQETWHKAAGMLRALGIRTP